MGLDMNDAVERTQARVWETPINGRDCNINGKENSQITLNRGAGKDLLGFVPVLMPFEISKKGLAMKMRTVFTSLFVVFWTISSLFAGPSKTLVLEDSINIQNRFLINELFESDVQFAGKMTYTRDGHLLLLAKDAVEWNTGVDENGQPVTSPMNLFECDPGSGSVVAAYLAKNVDGEIVTLKDIVFDETDGLYYGLDSENQVLYAYEYAPDEEKTITVEKTRMVEVVVEPEPEPEAAVEEEAEPAAAAPESAEIVNPQITDAVTSEAEPEAAVPSEEAVVQEEPEAVETAVAEVEETVSEEPQEVVAEEETTVSEPEESVEAEAVEEATPTPTEEEITEETPAAEPEAETAAEKVEEAAEAVVEDSTEAAEEPAETTTEDVAEEAVEEVVPAEPPAPVTKWVEEPYQEEQTIFVKHKFGDALRQYDLASLELESIADLQYDKETNTIIILGSNADGNDVIVSIRTSEDGSIVTSDLINTSTSDSSEVIFIDKVTRHWVIGGSEGLSVLARDGRLLRKTQSGMSDMFSDICNVPIVNEAGEVTGSQWMVFHYGQIGVLTWDRPGEDKIHHVPGEFVTIQAAVDAAKDGDWVMLSPGVYKESVKVVGKSINLISYYQTTEDLYFVENTVIRAENGAALSTEAVPNASLYVSGLHLTGSGVGLQSSGNITAENLEIVGNQTGALFSGGTAILSDCDILNNAGDGVVYRSATATLLERCSVTGNSGNGIDIAITPYDGELYRTVIRRNDITENGGSGIRFEDAPITTQREFRIENNFIISNKVAGVEVYLPQKDPKNPVPTGPRTKNSVYLINNTIVKNPVGVLRGGNYRMVNNIVAGSNVAAVKELMYHSLIIRNLFWENKEIAVDSNYQASNNREEDPVFVGNDYILSVRSPAKRAGIPGNLWNDDSDRSGADIGASR